MRRIIVFAPASVPAPAGRILLPTEMYQRKISAMVRLNMGMAGIPVLSRNSSGDGSITIVVEKDISCALRARGLHCIVIS